MRTRANQLLGKGKICRALGDEFAAEAESDTQESESLADSDLHELQPCALAHGGGRAAEDGAEENRAGA